jgi:hypothetical protein
VPIALILPSLTYLQSADANTWFKNLYARSDIIDVTLTAKRSVLLFDKKGFNIPDSLDLQKALKSFHILVTDNSYRAPNFNKAALVQILKSESKPFPFIGMSFFYYFRFRTRGNAITRSISARKGPSL